MTKIRSTDSSRIQDRRGGGGGGLSFPGLGRSGGMGGGMGIPMKSGGGLLGLLVVAAVIFLPRLFGGDGSGGLNQYGGGAAEQSGQGDPCQTEAEQIVCGANEDVQDYWGREYPQAFDGAEYQDTELVFFSGSTNTGCGGASAQTGPFYCPADNLVYIDLQFLDQLQQQFGAQGDLASQYIVAHEFGHHVQSVTGISEQVTRAQQQNPGQANELSVALELQADCYAGTWAHDAAARDQLDSPDEIDEALNAAAAVGDDRIQQQTQGRVDPESFTHGTSEQRVSWFRRGYSTGDPTQCDTFNEL
ncbi:MAG: KPN_02809 family neutral zinc metallopeptidase [Acidimicrobiales bacterium]